MNSKWFLFLSALPLVAQAPAKIDINVDGKPFATFNSGVDANKPYLWPIRSGRWQNHNPPLANGAEHG